MDTNRRIAIVAGILFITATVTQVAGHAIVSPILNATDYLAQIEANKEAVLASALLQFTGGVACTGIALALFPVLRRYDDGLALGSVAFRTIEGALYVLDVVCVLVLVSLSQGAAGAGSGGTVADAASGSLVRSFHDSLAPVAVLTFGLGAFMYYWVMYRARLVPRWLSAWGLVGIVLVMVSAVLVMLGAIEGFSSAQIVLAAPIAVQEMVLAVWLIAKGFDPSAIAAESSGATARRQAAAFGSAA